jgi:uncharacterized membrane protein YdjX (TVP38/TMEM64 family)
MRTTSGFDHRRMSIAGIFRAKRLWLAMAAFGVSAVAYQAGLFSHLTLEALREHRDGLTDWVDANVLLASVAYLAVYVGAVALSIPCAVFLTISGGFLFGAALGGPLAVFGSTLGATLLFLLVRLLLGSLTLDRFGPRAARLAEGIRRDAASYMLAMRFAPVFPFFLVNLVPAFVGVPLRTYVLTTLVGIIPVTMVFSLAGAGLGAAIDSGAALTAGMMLTPEILACLALLAMTSLASIPVRRWAERRISTTR